VWGEGGLWGEKGEGMITYERLRVAEKVVGVMILGWVIWVIWR